MMTYQMQASADAAMPVFLRRVLLLDAATGVGMALLHTAFGGTIAGVTGMPMALVLAAGLVLFPIAALMGWTALRAHVVAPAVWLVILGNVGWTIASFAIVLGPDIGLSAIGQFYICAQALSVLMFATLEFVGLRRALPTA